MAAIRTRPTLANLVAATPSSRDRYVDFLRALSIATVVAGHWLMAVVTFGDAGFAGENALDAVPGVWALTWLLQVMPLFFFVGGFSNSVAWDALRRKGGTYGDFVRTRAGRLLAPTIVFVAIWTVAASGARLFGMGGEGFALAMEMLAKPLWFLGVYLIVVALAPPMRAAHDRFGAHVPVALVAGAAAVDVIRIAGGVGGIGLLNFALVWLLPHQIGMAYADGSLARLGRRGHALLAAGGLAAMALLTAFGPYSLSMVGTTGERISNNSPPTVVLSALSIWLAGAAMLARPATARRLQRPATWARVIAANSMIMTVFLWHLSALLLGAAVLLPAGFPQPDAGTAAWWLLRPVWLLALAAFLVPFVAGLGRFERGSDSRSSVPRARPGAGLLLAVVGLSGLAAIGFAPAGGAGSLLAPPLFAVAAWAGARIATGKTA